MASPMERVGDSLPVCKVSFVNGFSAIMFCWRGYRKGSGGGGGV